MELMGLTLQHWRGAVRPMSSEKGMYNYIKRKTKDNFLYYKLENKYQQGIPDIMLLSDIIILLECKLCRKRVFASIQDVHWQPGQLHFAYVALMRRAPVLYVIAHGALWHILGADKPLVNKMGALLC